MQFFYRNVHENYWRFHLHIQRSVGAVVVALALFTVCAFSQITVSPASGSGVTNTGNAAVGDVASGKTFSSSVLTNATGTSTKNATVGGSASIQPAQPFVDEAIAQGIHNGGAINLPNKGITSALGYAQSVWDYLSCVAGVDLSGNALTSAEVNGLLALYVAHLSSPCDALTINLSGQTPAAPPTGQGITDKAALITAGWSVTTD